MELQNGYSYSFLESMVFCIFGCCLLYIWMLPIKNEEQEVAEEDQLIEGQV